MCVCMNQNQKAFFCAPNHKPMCVLQIRNQSISKNQKLKLNPKLEFYSKQKICVCPKTKL